MTIGTQDPIANPDDFTEIVNNQRVLTYAANAGITWLQDCNDCDPASTVLPGYPYVDVVSDPAPWYDPNDPDSTGFLGVMGLDVTGEENSTRQASVTMGLSGVGVIGPTYMGPRTMVVRALLVAEDDCSLQYGMTWLRKQYRTQHNPCGGDTMTFFDCCPCICDDPGKNIDCWADTYKQLKDGPGCLCGEPETWWRKTYYDYRVGPPPTTPDVPWWPLTYGEDAAGPPQPTDQFWPDRYGESLEGPPSTCERCLEPTPWSADTYGEWKTGPPAGELPWWPTIYGENVTGPPSADQWWPDTYGDIHEGAPSPCDEPQGPWWARVYREEMQGPPADVPPWWPDTYQQEVEGPTPGVDMWWYTTYAMEKAGPPPDPTIPPVEPPINPDVAWWPDTYGQLIEGPPADDPAWCNWADIYRELKHGAPTWSCCVEQCVVPYLRQFYQVRVTEGPTVLSSPVLHSKGAVAEIEFTIVAADPQVHGNVQRAGSTQVTGGVPVTDAPPPAPFSNPYRPKPVAVPDFVPTEWVRETMDVARLREQILTGIEPRLRVRASERSGPVRLGLWVGETRVAGYTIPFVAQNSAVVVSGQDAYYSSPNGHERLSAFVRDWDGKWPRALELPHGDYRLTIDQRADEAVKLFVDAFVAPVGSG
jgi:hypothetical protein